RPQPITGVRPSMSKDAKVTYSVPSTERPLNAKHFSRLPPKSVARQEALWQDTLREGSVRALCQGREYNTSGLPSHLHEALGARNPIARRPWLCCPRRPYPWTSQEGGDARRPTCSRVQSRPYEDAMLRPL